MKKKDIVHFNWTKNSQALLRKKLDFETNASFIREVEDSNYLELSNEEWNKQFDNFLFTHSIPYKLTFEIVDNRITFNLVRSTELVNALPKVKDYKREWDRANKPRLRKAKKERDLLNKSDKE